MKVLVTGGTGFTGSHTAAALLHAGHEVRLLVRNPAKVRPAFEPLNVLPTDIVLGDMTDANAVGEALHGCDGVVHVAALVDLRRLAARQVEATNARGVELVVGGAVRRGLPSIVYISSLGVFFTRGGPPLSPDLPIAAGTTAYARSKAEAERYVRRLQDQGAPIRISYPAGIMGPDDPWLSAATAGLLSMVRDRWIVTSGGYQVIDVRDLAALHLQLLELPPGPYRYGASGEMLTWEQAYALACSLTGLRLRRATVPGALLRAAGTIGDVVKRVRDTDYPLTRDAMEFVTRWPGTDTGRTTAELGFRPRPAADTYRDTLTWLYRAGHLRAEHVGDLAQLPTAS
jgi:nucleoside-diphosphate-sugar epimerase